MNKKDFRVQLPLWNIALWVILMIWSYGVIYAVDMLASDFEGVIVHTNDGVTINWHLPGVFSIIIGTLLLIVFFVVYLSKIKRHNQQNPSKQLAAFTFTKPGEFLQDDEMLRQVSENATKKIYIFYSHALPLLVFIIALLPVNRYLFVVLIFLMLMLQNALYYIEIRKFLSGNYILSTEQAPANNRHQKIITTFIILVFFVAITIPAVRITQVRVNNNAALEEFGACLDQGRTATIEYDEDGFATVECE